MPDITQRIADILKRHRFERCSESRSGYFAWWGRCSGCGVESQRRHIADGWEIDMQADESAHVAEVLITELGLTREQRTLADGMAGVTTNYKTGEVTHHSRPSTRQSRYVTDWVAE